MKKSEIEGWSGLIGAILFLGATLVPGYQVILWLKDGFWTPMPLELMLGWIGVDAVAYVSSMQWEGAKKVCMWIITLPLSVGFMAPAFAQFYFLNGIANTMCDDRQ